jgi:5'-nucleotidase
MMIITNDDGIDAPGIRALQVAAAKTMAKEIAIAAPRDHYSGCGHQVTTHAPIRIEKRAEHEYAIAGTPADCVRVALKHLYPSTKLVLSGINYGGNMGMDIYISGTVAAVREAAFHGIPGIAISHYRAKGREIDWELATILGAKVIDELLRHPYKSGTYWNVNLPHLQADSPDPEIIFCSPCIRPLPVDFTIDGDYLTYAGKYELRDRIANTDVDVCFSGNIAVSQIHL